MDKQRASTRRRRWHISYTVEARNVGKTRANMGETQHYPQPGPATGQDYRCANFPAHMAPIWLPQGHHATHTHVSLFSFCAHHRVFPRLRQHDRGQPLQKRVQRGQIWAISSRPPMPAQLRHIRQNSQEFGHSGPNSQAGLRSTAARQRL